MDQIEQACQELYKQQATEFLPILTALTPLLLRVENQVIHDERGYGLKLGGFYKDGSITVRPAVPDTTVSMNELYTIDGRYERLEDVFPGQDLLEAVLDLQVERFRYWNSVKPEFKEIDAQWLPILIEHNLVEPVVQTTYKVR